MIRVISPPETEVSVRRMVDLASRKITQELERFSRSSALKGPEIRSLVELTKAISDIDKQLKSIRTGGLADITTPEELYLYAREIVREWEQSHPSQECPETRPCCPVVASADLPATTPPPEEEAPPTLLP